MLFFDEPTNDLDVNTMRALEEAIESFAGSAVLVSHDRWFLDRLATHILAFEGDSQVQFFDGNYSQDQEYRKDVLGLKPFDPHRIKYPEADAMTLDGSQASRLTLVMAGAGLLLGGAALWLGLAESAIALWGFGAACLLLGLPSLGAWQRIQEGFGNRGLDRERLTLRAVSHLLRLLALGVVLTSVAALMGDRSPQVSFSALGVAALAIVLLGPLWIAKQRLGRNPSHPGTRRCPIPHPAGTRGPASGGWPSGPLVPLGGCRHRDGHGPAPVSRRPCLGEGHHPPGRFLWQLRKLRLRLGASRARP